MPKLGLLLDLSLATMGLHVGQNYPGEGYNHEFEVERRPDARSVHIFGLDLHCPCGAISQLADIVTPRPLYVRVVECCICHSWHVITVRIQINELVT